MPSVVPLHTILAGFEQARNLREERKAQAYKNLNAAIDLGLRKLAYTDESNWNETVAELQKMGIFSDSYAKNLQAGGYSALRVRELQEKGIAYKDKIALETQRQLTDAKLQRYGKQNELTDAQIQKIQSKMGGRGGGGGGGGGSGGGFFGTFTPTGEAGGAMPIAPVRRSVPVTPSSSGGGCSGGVCPVPVSSLDGKSSLSDMLAALPSNEQSRDTLSSIQDALAKGYQAPTAQPSALSSMLAAGPSQTMTDATPVAPKPPAFNYFPQGIALAPNPVNYKVSTKGVPSKEYADHVEKAMAGMLYAIWPPKLALESEAPTEDVAASRAVSPTYRPTAVKMFQERVRAGYDPDIVANDIVELFRNKTTPQTVRQAEAMDVRRPDINVARDRSSSAVEAESRAQAEPEPKQEQPESWYDRGKKYIEGLTGGEGTKEKGKKQRVKMVQDKNGKWVFVPVGE